MSDPINLIKAGKFRTDVYEVCLDPDLVTEYEALSQLVEDQADQDRGSLAGGTRVELQQRRDALKEDMQEATLSLVLRALPRSKYRALRDKYPPRRTEDGALLAEDVGVGADQEKFFPELIRACLAEPKLDDETFELLINERLTDRQWNDLALKALYLNRTDVDLPFSQAASAKRRISLPR